MITLKINVTTNLNYYSQTDSLVYEMKTEDVHEDFSSNKCLILVIIRLSQNTLMLQTN